MILSTNIQGYSQRLYNIPPHKRRRPKLTRSSHVDIHAVSINLSLGWSGSHRRSSEICCVQVLLRPLSVVGLITKIGKYDLIIKLREKTTVRGGSVQPIDTELMAIYKCSTNIPMGIRICTARSTMVLTRNLLLSELSSSPHSF